MYSQKLNVACRTQQEIHYSKQENQGLTSQFDPKETRAVYQVLFSFSHQPPPDACKAPGSQHGKSDFKILKYWTQRK